MSVLPSTADANGSLRHIRFVPKGDAKLLRRRHDPRALLRERAALQGKRLVTKQHLNHHLARIAGIK
jgi:hypothetical protein